MNYPLQLSFKIMALAPQISVTDAHGQLIFYVKQKLFTLKESVTVFADAEQTAPLYTIQADRIIDFSARYHFVDAQGDTIGAVQRQGMRSLWKARYEVLDGEQVVMTIREKNPWVKVLDGLLGQIPIVSLFSGYFLHPAYQVSRAESTEVMLLEKRPAFLEARFAVRRHVELDPKEETQILLSLLMMSLLERSRG